MNRSIPAIYRDGVLVLDANPGLTQGQHVQVLILPEAPHIPQPPKAATIADLLAGVPPLSAEEAEEMLKIIEESCGQVNPHGWN